MATFPPPPLSSRAGSRAGSLSGSDSESSEWDGTIEPSALTQEVIERKNLRKLSVRIFWWAMLGVLLMVLELELKFHYYEDKPSTVTTLIKCAISVATVVLLVYMNIYYAHQIILLRARNVLHVNDQLIHSRIFFIYLIEMVVCAYHVPPFLDFEISPSLDGTHNPMIPDEASIGMFLRAYLIVRMLRDNSPLTSSGGLLLGALGDVDITSSFILKTLLEVQATRWLFGSLIAAALVSSYAVHVFERTSNPQLAHFDDAIWFMVVTMTTVGYGDIYVFSTWGRFFTFVGAVIGVLITALGFAVTHKRMQMSSVETRVVRFFHNDRIAKTNRDMAARCIQFAWRYYQACSEDDNTALAGGLPAKSSGKLRIKRLRRVFQATRDWALYRRTTHRATVMTPSLLFEILLNHLQETYEELWSIDKRALRVLTLAAQEGEAFHDRWDGAVATSSKAIGVMERSGNHGRRHGHRPTAKMAPASNAATAKGHGHGRGPRADSSDYEENGEHETGPTVAELMHRTDTLLASVESLVARLDSFNDTVHPRLRSIDTLDDKVTLLSRRLIGAPGLYD